MIIGANVWICGETKWAKFVKKRKLVLNQFRNRIRSVI